MPEGPEVRTVSDQLRKLIVNKTVNQIKFDNRAKQRNLSKFIPSKVKDVYTHGKRLIFEFSSGQYIVTGFGMEGKWLINEPGNHSHIAFILDKLTLYFDDTRYFGSVVLYENEDQVNEFLNTLGFDPLTEEITFLEWKNLFQSRKQVCSILLDQHLISGVGNYLKSEILYASRILPTRLGNSLSDDELKLLYKNTIKICRKAYKEGGLTIRTYGDLEGNAGRFVPQVYGRDKDDQGNTIEVCKCKDGRTSYFVPGVQI